MLKDSENNWIEGSGLLKDMVQNYFFNLFHCNSNVTPACTGNGFPQLNNTFSLEDNLRLCATVSNMEIWNTVQCINPYKAPGPDGIQAFFYHKFWDIVGKDVCDFVKNYFQSASIPRDVNKTLIVLIPKCDNPDSLKLFRPISLCNVLYKIITKIIVGRIRPLLHKIVSPFQSSFIPGRSTNDNVIITQEILHTLRLKKGKRGGMVFKIDLEKAYDKISWAFLEETLRFFKLNDTWISLIMECVSNV